MAQKIYTNIDVKGQTTTDAIQLTTVPTTVAAGKFWYDGATGSFNAGMGGGNITQQVGEELFIYGKATSAIVDTPLQIIYKTGTVGASGVLTFAPTVAGITDSNLILGCATESIAIGGFGRITTYGVIHGLSTNGVAYGETWVDGDSIWYNPITGNPTKIKPIAPNIIVFLGIVLNAAGGGAGSFQVELQRGSGLGVTDSNVLFTSLTNNDILAYESSTALWKNKSISTILGYTPANDSSVVHLAGTETISGTKTFSSGSTIWDNASSSILDFKISGTSVANFNFGSTFTQFTSKATSGYLFKNSSLANSLAIDNSGNGTFLGSLTASSIIKSGGTSIQFLKADGSVDSSTYASDSNVVHLTGAETITGTKSFNSTTGIGIRSNNSGNGYGVYSDNSSTGIAYYVANSGQGKGFLVANALNSLGNLFEGSYNGTQNLVVNYLGELTASKLIKSGGTSSQFLKADGSVDSSTYHTGTGTSGYHAKFTGASTLGNSLIYDNGTNVGIGTTAPASKLNVSGDNITVSAGYGIAYSGDQTRIMTPEDNVSGALIRYGSGGIMRFVNGSTEHMRINATGNVLIGTSSSIGSGIFQVKTSSANNVAYFQNGTSDAGYGLVFLNVAGSAVGSIGWTNAMTSYNITSDYRLKEDFKDYSGLDLISKIKTYDYKWKVSEDRMYGVKAHELQEVVPYAVTGEKDAELMQSVDYSKLVPILVQAIQELQEKINILENK
jgi:hypothetical protein